MRTDPRGMKKNKFNCVNHRERRDTEDFIIWVLVSRFWGLGSGGG